MVLFVVIAMIAMTIMLCQVRKLMSLYHGESWLMVLLGFAGILSNILVVADSNS
jgi:Co/Zn/Cd efflux system component